MHRNVEPVYHETIVPLRRYLFGVVIVWYALGALAGLLPAVGALLAGNLAYEGMRKNFGLPKRFVAVSAMGLLVGLAGSSYYVIGSWEYVCVQVILCALAALISHFTSRHAKKKQEPTR